MDKNETFKSGNLSKQEVKNKARDKTSERETDKVRGLPVGILGIVFTLLIVAMLFAKFRGSEQIPTFTSLLEWFSGFSAPEIPFITMETAASLGDWTAAFNWLRDIVYFSIQIVNVLVFLCNGIIIAIGYIVHFCQWLFMV